jgi:hypothetical protein
MRRLRRRHPWIACQLQRLVRRRRAGPRRPPTQRQSTYTNTAPPFVRGDEAEQQSRQRPEAGPGAYCVLPGVTAIANGRVEVQQAEASSRHSPLEHPPHRALKWRGNASTHGETGYRWAWYRHPASGAGEAKGERVANNRHHRPTELQDRREQFCLPVDVADSNPDPVPDESRVELAMRRLRRNGEQHSTDDVTRNSHSIERRLVCLTPEFSCERIKSKRVRSTRHPQIVRQLQRSLDGLVEIANAAQRRCIADN